MATPGEYVSRLDRALKAAGHAIDGVSVQPDGSVKVSPAALQAVCQPIIDSFDANDPAYVTAEQDAEIDGLKALRALAQATFELKSNAWTQAQFLARIKAIYRAL